jgi:hypothetical protein
VLKNVSTNASTACTELRSVITDSAAITVTAANA